MISFKLLRVVAEFVLFGSLGCGITSVASASVITVPINATVGTDSTFDLNGAGVPNLGFWSRQSKFFGAYVYSNGPTAGFEVNSTLDAVPVLKPGDTVGPSAQFFSSTGSAFALNSYNGSGDFLLDQTSYLGFVNKANGNTQYGFIEFKLIFDVNFDGEAINIDSVSYGNTGAAISIPTPEPDASSLLVALPLVWWRLKRNAAIKKRQQS
jgi:hypothetical protein